MIEKKQDDSGLWDELDVLTSGWIDNQLTDVEGQRLRHILSQSAEYRRYYLNMVHTDTLASQIIKSEHLLARPLIPVDQILKEQKRRAAQIALLSTVALILLMATIMRFYFLPEPETRALTFDVSAGSQFTLSHSSTDTEPAADIKGQVLKIGSRLQLSQGVVELGFPSGVSAVVMAPADITLERDNQLILDTGTAWFDVPPEAIGFTVKTHQLTVVDLGTKFGVSSHPNESLDQVHVFKGRVSVSAKNKPRDVIVVVANEARELTPTGKLETISCEPARFLTHLPETLPHLHWDFDSLNGDQLAVRGTHPETLDLISTLETQNEGGRLVNGKLGKALYLNGDDSYVITNWAGFGGGRPRTVSFWLKLPEDGVIPRRASLISWGDTSINSARWQLLVNRSNSEASKGEPELAFGLRLGMRTVKPYLKFGQWQHIAVSYSGEPDARGYYREEVYVDGRAVELEISESQKEPVNTGILSKGARPLSIGVTLRGKQKRHCFKGAIDDLYIYDGYMTASQIQNLEKQQAENHPSLSK